MHVKGARSYQDLRTVDGVQYDTYREAADHRNLLQNDDEWQRCMGEASLTNMPSQLRQLFALICTFNTPNDPVQLFQQFEEHLIEDFAMNDIQEVAVQKALQEIEATLILHGLCCRDLRLSIAEIAVIYENNEQDDNDRALHPDRLIASLTETQREVLEEIVAAIDDVERPHRFFFLDGLGGSGKTYLYNTLISHLNRQNKIVLSYATTGIAADLLIGGRTAHSGMKLPIPILETSTSRMRIPCESSEKLRLAHLLIIDEASMLSRNALRIIDLLLQEIMNSNRPFGGKVLLLGGDFWQTAPVIRRGSHAAVIEASVRQFYQWKHVTKLSLTQNMRIAGQVDFNNWLLQIGNGTLSNDEGLDEDLIEIPQDMLSTGNIVRDIFGESLSIESEVELEDVTTKTILTPRNKDALKLNNEILTLMPGETVIYRSVDSVTTDEEATADTYPMEFVNSLTPSGMPPHELKLKKGSIVMLLRNLNPLRGLLNGTRLLIVSLNELYVHGKIISGSRKGEQSLIPRLNLSPSDADLPFRMTWRQFPVMPAFVMTINKSQGQSFNKVGLYLPAPVFSHGQLYVALSRCRNRNNLKILVSNNESQGIMINNRVFTRNIVLKELLS